MSVISNIIKLASGILPHRATPVEAVLEHSPDVLQICRDLGPFAQPLAHIVEPEKALDLKAPTLKRPVLLVHGLAKHADTWVNMKNFLCGNSDNSYGGVYRTGHRSEFFEQQVQGPPAQVFAINISDNLASPADTYKELQEALGCIRGATGASKIDIVTHSMGSFVAREAARQGSADLIGNLVMLAPPNQGAYGANLLLNARRVGYHRYPDGHNGALEALRLEKGPMGGVANAFLHELNQGWSEENGIQAAIITGVGVPTPDRSWKGVSTGDGMVAVERAPLGETPMFVACDRAAKPGTPFYRDFEALRYNHQSIVSDAEVYQKVGELLSRTLPGENRLEPEPHQIDLSEIEPTFQPPRAEAEAEQFRLF